MKEKLFNLFDFQKFMGHERLDKMILDAEECLENKLSDDELDLVWAAKGTEPIQKKEQPQ